MKHILLLLAICSLHWQSFSQSNCTLNKTVFGWHPYWVNGLEDNYNWDLISDLCYFSYEVDAATGNATSTHSWSTADVIDTALVKGKKVHLCVTLFSQHATFFGNATAQTTLINNLVNLVQTRGAHGINIDFEGVPSGQSANLTAFMTNLGNALHTANPNYQLSICLYAVDWGNVFDETALTNVVDFYTIMGYDYYYSGSSQAGPTDPLYGFSSSYDYSLSRSVSYYLNAGIPSSKLILGLPYYGREWETTSNVVLANTTGANVYSRTYRFVKDNASGFYINPVSNTRSSSTGYIFQNAGTWRQCWISEADNLKDRYELVHRRNLRGIGIWTLGYDDGYQELWNAINEKLTDCRQWACTDTLYDEGGPEVSYYNNELVQYTINPPGATSLQVNFLEFATEANFDTLWLYDGPNTNAPLIGYYHGNNSPGSFSTTGGNLTLRFKSDGGTRASGWKMAYSCSQDSENPQTVISLSNSWQTVNTTVDFVDTDDVGVTEKYWNASALLNNEWKGNDAIGHVYDECSDLANWVTAVGSWTANSGNILQNDDANGNTNAYISSPLTGANEYLFEWEGSISGSGNSRRAGMHYMCSDLTLTNRGNSYFIWFRVDNDVIQLYEVTNDVFSVVAAFPFTIDPGVSYNCKVSYSLLSGKMDVFVDNQFVGSWTDSTPLTQSTGISLRSGNAIFSVNKVAVYSGRSSSSENLLVGPGGHFYTDNPSLPENAGMIRSIAVDAAHNIGATEESFAVDVTKPVLSLPTETISDIDTLVNTTSLELASLVASDTNSGITTHIVWVEHSDGTIILPETAVTASSMFEILNGLSNGEIYYIRSRATNGAGLMSDTISSDGFVYITIAAISASEENLPQLWPNPASDVIHLSNLKAGTLMLFDQHGEIIKKVVITSGETELDIVDLPSGVYFVRLGKYLIRFVKY